ncbi:MAG: RsmD family RNA methyltransferase [Candidatus Peribacteraceae bacterium]|nr:RsmD family RNA methyltransferase [Candidatus Peribacteraceae bacterium]MDD5741941.1 RsmD family RNA methyltransferase [Candidatus Peribacteraceae bacterium]
MPSYAAFLGHQPRISLAELSASVPGFVLRSVVKDSIVLFDSPVELDSAFLDTLGGIVILARRVTDQAVTLAEVPSILLSELKDAKRGKVVFALRTFLIPRQTIHTLYRQCKESLRKQGRPCRYVGSEREPAATVLLRDAGLLDPKRGCELVLLPEGDEEENASLWVGRTVAAQDVNAYTKRDIGKPVRDTTVGLLPPKLAQILLNLGAWLARGGTTPMPDPALKKTKKADPLTVFDPFCGTGVIPMECLVRGWHVYASDLAQKAVNGTEKNLEWLRKELKIFKKDADATVWKQDATKPFVLKTPPDLIVTETTLGPALEDRPSQKSAAKMKTELEKIEAAFIENCSHTLPGVPLALTWPFWKIKNETIFLDRAWEAVHKTGYMATLPPGIAPSREERLSLLYRRPDQYVGREIVLLLPRKRK